LVDFGIHFPYSRCRLVAEKQINIQSPHNSQTTHKSTNNNTRLRRVV
jgi:hypothetical protein